MEYKTKMERIRAHRRITKKQALKYEKNSLMIEYDKILPIKIQK